jgi:hypothetical protein
MNPWITNFPLLVISRHKSRVRARVARQWACPRFISVVCAINRAEIRIQVRCTCQQRIFGAKRPFFSPWLRQTRLLPWGWRMWFWKTKSNFINKNLVKSVTRIRWVVRLHARIYTACVSADITSCSRFLNLQDQHPGKDEFSVGRVRVTDDRIAKLWRYPQIRFI